LCFTVVSIPRGSGQNAYVWVPVCGADLKVDSGKAVRVSLLGLHHEQSANQHSAREETTAIVMAERNNTASSRNAGWNKL